MSDFSTYGATAVLNGTAPPATMYVQLHTGAPSADGTANVASTPGRQSFTRDTAAAGTTANDVAVEWSGSGVAEIVTHISIHDAAAAGNCWFVKKLEAPQEVLAGGDVTIGVGELDLTLVVYVES